MIRKRKRFRGLEFPSTLRQNYSVGISKLWGRKLFSSYSDGFKLCRKRAVNDPRMILLPRPVLLILNECNIQHIPESGVFAVNVNPSYAHRCSLPHTLLCTWHICVTHRHRERERESTQTFSYFIAFIPEPMSTLLSTPYTWSFQ